MRALIVLAKALLAHMAASYVCYAVYFIKWSYEDNEPLGKIVPFRFFLKAPMHVYGLIQAQFERGGTIDDYTGFAIVTAAYLIPLIMVCGVLFRRWRPKPPTSPMDASDPERATIRN